MAKTYNTISTFTSGQILTATQMNQIGTNSNNYRVPPSCSVYRSSDATGYTSSLITWQAADYDTESPTDPMWASGANANKVYIRTAGIYAICFRFYLTATASITLMETDIYLNANVINVVNSPVFSTTAAYGLATHVQKCAAGDYVGAALSPTGGSAYVVKGGASDTYAQTRLTVTWLGQTA